MPLQTRDTFSYQAALISLYLGLSTLATTLTPALAEIPNQRDGRYFNPWEDSPDKSILTFMRHRFLDGNWPDSNDYVGTTPETKAQIPVRSHQPRVTWLGHSTCLIQHQGLNILTDPVFSDRAGPGGLGPRRFSPPAVDAEDLPPIDLVVISHNHYDHLDKALVRTLGDGPVWLVPMGLEGWFVQQGIAPGRVMAMNWFESASLKGIEIIATPVQHWSRRGLFDTNRTLWNGWRLNFDDFSVWFAGDTGYHAFPFEETRRRLGPVDLALIPVGAYEPRSFMKNSHVNPEEAVQVFMDVQARQAIGIHWGTFVLTSEPPTDPPKRLVRARAAAGLAPDRFMLLPLGGHWQRTPQ
jgi:N-acyl-phosphatidylethanolamine-hydrolysing phospholipase D